MKDRTKTTTYTPEEITAYIEQNWANLLPF